MSCVALEEKASTLPFNVNTMAILDVTALSLALRLFRK
jgi:hypothetical protein